MIASTPSGAGQKIIGYRQIIPAISGAGQEIIG